VVPTYTHCTESQNSDPELQLQLLVNSGMALTVERWVYYRQALHVCCGLFLLLWCLHSTTGNNLAQHHEHFHHHLANRRHRQAHWCIQRTVEEVVDIMNRTVKTIHMDRSKWTELNKTVLAFNDSWYHEAMEFHGHNQQYLDSVRVTKPDPHLEFDGLGFYANDNLDILVFNAFFKKGNFAHRNGTYLETGGSNGIHASNTLFFSDFLGWRGLLIEPTYCAVCQLAKNRPFDRTIHAGICKERTTFDARSMNGFCPMSQQKCVNQSAIAHDVDCLPTRDMILAANVTVIDLVTIDVESHFMDVLTSIDWSATTIPVLVVECDTEECFSFLKDKGYEVIKPGTVDGVSIDVIAWKNGCYHDSW
jgi:hypothetical protein